ncbi:AlkZ family DNA glycosylase [Mucilaginibacter sp. ZT4R22]|uniref:AlkZ family DNA glycosylase n=1 Tax=Mucilaginibacter pankratovii TaxID=2772110 RepID=A0ABR7WWF8_9SPHI|nr:winged helix DNA-binding domain-containing protein [Mucilaginibacter pankratovii]MBD1366623.1 AlkZ family DNA glycosylase [Mucilaginibacter pankratovii]
MGLLNITDIRLQNQHLVNTEFSNPADVVKSMGAVQSQDYNGAKWALGQRMKNATDDLIDKALADGDIIRTHVLRPTWHFVHPADIRWMLELTAKRIQAAAASYHRQLQLDKQILAKCENLIVKALNGRQQMAREEVAAFFNQHGIATNEQRFVHIMEHLELEQLVCSGGREGKRFTYALFDERVPKTKPIDKAEAIAMLAERYFTSHGPATIADFAWWSGLTNTDAKAGLEAVKSKLSSHEADGNTYWFVEREAAGVKTNMVQLLPNYDEYIVSYKDRGATIDTKYISKADPRGTIFNHTILINGKIEGLWKRAIKKDALEVELTPFKALSQQNLKAVEKAAKAYAKFLGLRHVIIV